MAMLTEFKEFAVKGNVIDLAVGVIIGAAFGKIVESVVGDLIMPVVGAIFGKLDFSSLFLVLGQVPSGTPMTLDALKTCHSRVALVPGPMIAGVAENDWMIGWSVTETVTVVCAVVWGCVADIV